MIEGISPILELEVQLFNIKKEHNEALKEAFIDGYGICYDEEQVNDAWMLSSTYRKLTTGE